MEPTKNKRTQRYQLRFRDSNGKQQQFSAKRHFPPGTTKREAYKIAQVIYEAHEDTINGNIRPFLSDCVQRMLNHLENNRVKGISNYKSHVNCVLQWDNNNTIDEIAEVCTKMRDDMLAMKKPNGDPKYSTGTIIKRMYIFKRTASLAYEDWDILPNSLTHKMKAPKKPKSRVRYLDREECGRLLNACENDQIRYILEFYVLTGIRHAELKRMQACDFLNGRIIIAGKNGHTRSFKIADRALELAGKISFPVQLTYWELRLAFDAAKAKAGITDFNMHDLRHTFASWLAQSGSGLQRLQEVMGHQDINQTTKYAHLMPEDLDSVAVNLSVNPAGQMVH